MGKLLFAVFLLLGLAGCPAEPTVFTPVAPSVPQPRLPLNDAYQGNVHFTETLRPRFVWAASTTETSNSVVYQLQVSEERSFSTSSTQTFTTEETSFDLPAALSVSMSPPVGRRYYWRLRACVRYSCSAYARTRWLNLGRSNKDYNGDGDADLAVGAPNGSGGRVHLYFGGPGIEFDTAVDATLSQPSSVVFGYAVASAGDVNADGFSDLLVGDYGLSNSMGAAYLYLGGPGAFDITPDASFFADTYALQGLSVSSAGDLDGDEFSDVVVGGPFAQFMGIDSGVATIHFGSKAGKLDRYVIISSTSMDQIGRSLAPIGDINGDGFADLAVGSLGRNSFGTVSVFLGAESFNAAAAMKVPGNVSEDFQGATLLSADVNRDGLSDLLVGVPAMMAPSKAGRVDLYLGGEPLDRNPDLTVNGATASDKLGQSIASGDFNGDGRLDLVLGALSADSGTARIHFGQDSVLVSPSAVGTLPGNSMISGYAQALASGDFNGDGFDDLAVGSPGGNNNAGRVYVYFGGSGETFDLTPDGVIDGRESNAGLGFAIANP